MKPRACVASACRFAAILAIGPAPLAQQADPSLASQPARPSPEWLKSGVIYQIFIRSFSASGDLNGVTAKLDDLRALHVNILWLMPIHPYGQVKKKGSLGSPYAVRDYYAIDSPLGTKDDLHRLVQEAHKRQMKVIRAPREGSSPARMKRAGTGRIRRHHRLPQRASYAFIHFRNRRCAGFSTT
jgi:hypothetical protein